MDFFSLTHDDPVSSMTLYETGGVPIAREPKKLGAESIDEMGEGIQE